MDVINMFGNMFAVGLMKLGATRIDHKVNRDTTISNDKMDQIMSAALESGVRVFDTAEGYGGGTSEERLLDARLRQQDETPPRITVPANNVTGAAFDVYDWSNERQRVIISTKFLPTLWRWSKFSLYNALRGSLLRLQVPSIDLYFIHSPVHPLALEFWIDAACDCMDVGLIKAIGVSNCGAEQVRRAHAAAQKRGYRIAVNQILFNLLSYNSSEIREVERVCAELGVTLLAFNVLGQGLLCDGLTEEKMKSVRAARIAGVSWHDEEFRTLVRAIEGVARRHERTMAQVNIAWCMWKGHIPLIGCTKEHHVTEAAPACIDRFLSESDVRELEEAALARSTLSKPMWRRSLFILLISALVLAYRFELFFFSRRRIPERVEEESGRDEREKKSD